MHLLCRLSGRPFQTLVLSALIILTTYYASAQTSTLPVKGWAKNSVNSVIFRRNSVVTADSVQYTAFYDSTGYVILGKRRTGTITWETKKTPYTGNIQDAHNSISIMVDGSGYLHMSWDHHNNSLNYCRSVSPGSLDLTAKMTMIGSEEVDVTYPEFHRLAGGDLIFMYRNGASGNGNLVINRYNLQQQKWQRLHSNLIDGQGQRNAYWQAFADESGTLHLSWVWRETWDVATNHDICYAVSTDGGYTWRKSTGQSYTLPITAATSEYAAIIPQNSELINQTSMYGDANGNPYICNYWTPSGSNIPQFHLVYHNGSQWQTVQVSNRTTAFSLSGGGTKKIPISRPQIMVDNNQTSTKVYILYRDQEQGDKVTLSFCEDLTTNNWNLLNLTEYVVGSWEPSYDTELWKTDQVMNIFVQRVGQGDGETLEDLPAQPVTILEWRPDQLQPDCNGTINGTAFTDNCGVCVGGGTGKNPCAALTEGYYTIESVNSGLCINPASQVSQEACTEQSGQVWRVSKGETYYHITAAASGGYMTANGNTRGNSVSLSNNAYEVRLEEDGNGNFFLVNSSNTNLVFDVEGASLNPGAAVLQWTRNNQNNQRFSFTPSAISEDCNGDFGGSALKDNCDRCIGGNTGNMSCSGTLEAEDACAFDGVIESDHPGYNGTGYINAPNVIDGSITTSVTTQSAGEAIISFRYANGSTNDRPGVLTINGAEIPGTLSFVPTEGWSNWSTLDIPIQLIQGNNLITLKSTVAEGLPNVDQTNLVSAGLSEGNCTITATNGVKSTVATRLFPNPSNESFTLKMPFTKNVKVYSTHGMLIDDLGDISFGQFGEKYDAGIYFVHIKSDGKTEVYKMVKM